MERKDIKILNVEEARHLVASFNKKINDIYEKLDSDYAYKNRKIHVNDNIDKVDIEIITSTLTSDELHKLNKAIILLQRQLRTKISEDTLIPFNPKGDYQSDARVFANTKL